MTKKKHKFNGEPKKRVPASKPGQMKMKQKAFMIWKHI
jgi:hypothetical protein